MLGHHLDDIMGAYASEEIREELRFPVFSDFIAGDQELLSLREGVPRVLNINADVSVWSSILERYRKSKFPYEFGDMNTPVTYFNLVFVFPMRTVVEEKESAGVDAPECVQLVLPHQAVEYSQDGSVAGLLAIVMIAYKLVGIETSEAATLAPCLLLKRIKPEDEENPDVRTQDIALFGTPLLPITGSVSIVFDAYFRNEFSELMHAVSAERFY